MRRSWLVTSCLLILTAGGCGKESGQPAASGAAEPATLQLNWKPEPEFGGFYAADYAAHNLKVDVVPGGAGTPTIELLGAGKVGFAVVAADEIPKAREQGIHAVALFAAYQTNPQGLITQSKRGFKTIADVFKDPGTLAIEAGLPYSDYLKQQFGFDKLKIVPSPFGDLSVLRTDDHYTMQCFVTSEPLAAKNAGLDVTTFLIADSGYNPYASVLATTDEYAKAHPEAVRNMVAAVKEGWRKYLDDPTPANQSMNVLNPTMDLPTFAASAKAQQPLIETVETKAGGLGWMSNDRWLTLVRQLKSLNVIKSDVNPKDCYLAP